MSVVLVAEDDPDVRDLVLLKLRRSGFRVVAVDDGEQALAAAREHPPDVVLLDVSLPELSGLDVCRALRADPATARIPILMMTARARDSDVGAGYLAGADDYVVKPFSPKDLIARIELLMARERR